MRLKGIKYATIMQRGIKLRNEDKTDEQLLIAYYAGDDLAFTTLRNRHYEATYQLAHRAVGNKEKAEDIAVEVWLAIATQRFNPEFARWNHLKNGPVRPWILKIANNKTVDLIRKKEPERDSVENSQDSFHDGAPSVENAVTDKIYLDHFLATQCTPREMEIICALRSTLVGTTINKGEAARKVGVSSALISKILPKFIEKWLAYHKEQEGVDK